VIKTFLLVTTAFVTVNASGIVDDFSKIARTSKWVALDTSGDPSKYLIPAPEDKDPQATALKNANDLNRRLVMNNAELGLRIKRNKELHDYLNSVLQKEADDQFCDLTLIHHEMAELRAIHAVEIERIRQNHADKMNEYQSVLAHFLCFVGNENSILDFGYAKHGTLDLLKQLKEKYEEERKPQENDVK
jgi:hypothetical protein